ncbi:MAG: hypothetical protein ACPHCL_07200 [Candidatus Puniceispirillaceae bacterium]
MPRPITALILGSGPDAQFADKLPLHQFDYIIAINNAWRATPHWTHLVYPYDFPVDRMPTQIGKTQSLIDERAFVPAQNRFGGFVYAGGTMAYTAAYWCLDALRPQHIAHLGCDMHYPKNQATHFYGTGAPDPLRDDISLTSLEASSARFYALAHQQGTQIWNLSNGVSRLLYPRITPEAFFEFNRQQPEPDSAVIAEGLHREAELGYFIEDGRYWHHADKFDKQKLIELDHIWLKAAGLAQTN